MAKLHPFHSELLQNWINIMRQRQLDHSSDRLGRPSHPPHDHNKVSKHKKAKRQI